MITRSPEVFDGQTKLACGNFYPSNQPARAAFTLIELMIVVAIIAIIATLLLPALNRSKSRAQTIMCINNNRQLGYVWILYSRDNNDNLAYNLGSSPQMSVSMFNSTVNPNWVNNIMDWGLEPANTNLNFVNFSIFSAYAFTPNIYHCPADRAVSPAQKSAGWTSRVRSVSMNGMVGNPGNIFHGGVNTINPDYEQYLKENDLKDPSSIFVFLDEHPDSINDGYFLDTNNYEWIDLPGSYHNGGGSFSFADGHTEIHRWKNATTMPPSVYEGASLAVPVDPSDVDFNWILNHTSTRNN